MLKLRTVQIGTAALCLAFSVTAVSACAGGKRKKSSASKWLKDPSTAEKIGSVLYWEDLGVTFEKPDTLYVYKECSEAAHNAESENGWVPVLVCTSAAAPAATDDSDFDEFATEDNTSTAAEDISITIYATKKTRPLDERTVSWFENQYKQAGFQVDDLSYQHDFQNKSGIYAKMQVLDGSSGLPQREILQFMFPKRDIVFIARTEYPFGDSRAIPNDWKYILWNFDTDPDLEELKEEAQGG